MRNQSAAISAAEETTHEEWNKAQLSGYTCISSLITQLVSIFCDLVDLPKKMGERYAALALGGALVLVLVTAAQGERNAMEIKGTVVVMAACGGFRPAPDDRAVVRAAGSSILPTSARILAPPRAGLSMARVAILEPRARSYPSAGTS